jgi:hypothetical protein
MKRKLTAWVCIGITALAVLHACTHEIPATSVTDPGNSVTVIPGSSGRTCSADSVYFANEILPLVNSGCAMAGCHDAVTHAEGLNLTTYSGIMKIVTPGRASSSKLYTIIVKSGGDRMPPPPQSPLAADKITRIQQWINQGAKNNVCDKCDTTDFKYSTAIKTLLQNKCVGCHSTASPGGGIDLSSYSAVKTVALSGKLYGSVNGSPGFSFMPKGTNRLPDCEIRQIRKWIDAGALNN